MSKPRLIVTYYKENGIWTGWHWRAKCDDPRRFIYHLSGPFRTKRAAMKDYAKSKWQFKSS